MEDRRTLQEAKEWWENMPFKKLIPLAAKYGVEKYLTISDGQLLHVYHSEHPSTVEREACKKPCGDNYCDEYGCTNAKPEFGEPSPPNSTVEPDQVPDIGKMVENPEAAEPDKGNAVEEADFDEAIKQNENFGKRIIDYAEKFAGTGKYNDVLKAIEFGYHLEQSQSTQRIKELEEALLKISQMSDPGSYLNAVINRDLLRVSDPKRSNTNKNFCNKTEQRKD